MNNPIIFPQSCQPELEPLCANGLILFNMTGAGRHPNVIRDNRGKLETNNFFKILTPEGEATEPYIKAVPTIENILRQYPEIEDIYWRQEHQVQQILNRITVPRLKFNPEKIVRLKEQYFAERWQIISTIEAEFGTRIETPTISEFKKLPEFKNDVMMTVEKWRAGFSHQNEGEYVMYVLESRVADSERCAAIFWIFNTCDAVLRWIEKIENNGYKLASTYILNFNTKTGRIYTKNEYLQGLPKPLRNAIEPSEGCRIQSIDYSIHEPVIYGWLAGGEIRHALNDPNLDIYEAVGRVAGCISSIVPEKIRTTGKKLLNAFLNGVTAYGIGKELNCSQNKAEAILQAISTMFAGTMENFALLKRDWYDGQVLRYEVNGMRFCRPIAPLSPKASNHFKSEHDEEITTCIIQGISSLILKAVLLRLPELLTRHGLTLLFPVHDSLLLEVPESGYLEAGEAVQGLMNGVLREFTGMNCERTPAKIEQNWMMERPIR